MPPYATPPYATPQYGAQQYGAQPYGVQYGLASRGEPRTVTRINLALVITGSVALGVFWATNLLGSLLAGIDPFGSSFGSTRAAAWDGFRLTSIIPVIGPWIQLAVKPTRFETDGWGTWLIADGILQTVGLGLLVIGLAVQNTETVYARSNRMQWALLPAIGPGQSGMTVLGRF